MPAHPAFELDGVSEVIDKYTGTWAVCSYLWTASMGSAPDAIAFGTLTVTGGSAPPPPPPPPPGAAPLTVKLTSTRQTKAKVRSSGFSFGVAPSHAGRLSARVYVKSGRTRQACGRQIAATYAAAGVFKRSSGKPLRTSSCASDVSGRKTQGTSQFTVRRT